jgi:hypothetical protein
VYANVKAREHIMIVDVTKKYVPTVVKKERMGNESG